MTAHRTPADAGIAGDGWQAGFLHALRASGNVSAAARAAGTCRSRCYEARRRDPGFAAAFDLLAFRLADQAWLLLQIGLGGYVVGRSVEKISPQITAISNAAPPRQRHGPQAKSRSKSRPASGHAKSG